MWLSILDALIFSAARLACIFSYSSQAYVTFACSLTPFTSLHAPQTLSLSLSLSRTRLKPINPPPPANMRPSRLALRGRAAAVLLARRLDAVRHRRRPRQLPVRLVLRLRHVDRRGQGGARAGTQASRNVRGLGCCCRRQARGFVVPLPGTARCTFSSSGERPRGSMNRCHGMFIQILLLHNLFQG